MILRFLLVRLDYVNGCYVRRVEQYHLIYQSLQVARIGPEVDDFCQTEVFVIPMERFVISRTPRD